MEIIPVIAPVQIASSSATGNLPASMFLTLLPLIRREARLAFRLVRPDLREELMAEVVANSYCAYIRLADRGKLDAAYATPLAQFAIRQVRSGRRVGTRLNANDITSRYARLTNDFIVERLDQHDDEGHWKEALVEDRHAGPAETAAARIDLAAWLRSLPHRRRRIALTLASGETTKVAAREFNLSATRISQIRNELEESWGAFQGETSTAAV
jgi:hypothetical protein